MLGALVAQTVTAAPPFRHGLAALGVTFIVCGIVGVRPISSDVIPQPFLACLGAAVTIYANSGANTFSKTALSNSTLVGIGLISYSLYLWYWPIIVFYRYAVTDSLGAFDIPFILAMTLIASVATWVYVEQPIRSRRLLAGPLPIFSTTIITGICLLAVSALGIATKGLPSRIPLQIVQLANSKDDINPARSKCIDNEPANALSGNFCRLGLNNAVPAFMVWGDSQADPWMPVFQDLAVEARTAGLFAAHAGCPPLLGIKRLNQTPSHRCAEFNEAVFATINRFNLHNVVLIGRWAWYIYGVEKGGQEEGPGAIIVRVDDDDTRRAAEIPRRKQVFWLAVAETTRRLRGLGADIWVIDQPPTYTFQVTKYLAYSAMRRTPLVGRARADVRTEHAFQLNVFRANDLHLVDTTNVLCSPEELFCRMQVDAKSIYSVYNHLSTFGAHAVAKFAASSFPRFHRP
jgi:hypothetical protein